MREITIAGGGLAGLALGICLRKKQVPVTIWEAGGYPRHRVCGEFINGRGFHVLRRLDLLESLHSAGAVQARTALFCTARAASPVRPLPEPALCLSRYELDQVLARSYSELGGVLLERKRWRGDFSEGIVRATGRRPAVNRQHSQWYGLKAHLRDVPLAADLEMHAFETGYVGLCLVEGGTVNVCGLFRRRPGASGSPVTRDVLFGPPGSELRERLAKAKTDERAMCSVAALPMRQRMNVRDGISVGDSIAMLPPVTGNGMSMAFESAELAAEPLAAYSRGELTWEAASGQTAAAQERRFASRLRWAKWLNNLMFTPAMRSSVGSCLLRSEVLWRVFYRATR